MEEFDQTKEDINKTKITDKFSIAQVQFNLDSGLPPLYGYRQKSKTQYDTSNQELFNEIHSQIQIPSFIKYSSVFQLFTGVLYINSVTMHESCIYSDDTDFTQCNIEHIFPQCRFKEHKELKYDLHHIFLCNMKINSKRSNYRFEQIDGINDGKYRVTTANHIFNPSIKFKGKVARALAYVFTLYPSLINDIISFDTIVIWNMISPVTEEEIERNNLVEQIQGNRNPYIDNPSLINSIWGTHDITMRVNGEEIHYSC